MPKTTKVPSDAISSLHPEPSINDSVCTDFASRRKRFFHWGPIVVFCVLTYLGIDSLFILLKVFPPGKSPLNTVHFIIATVELYSLFTSYCYAHFTGPGFVPLRWRPVSLTSANILVIVKANKSQEQRLLYCAYCEGYKPPRAHHCRACGRCVLKMDHHCPWLNTCCGHLNHGYFMQFVITVVMSAFHFAAITSLLLGMQFYASYYQFKSWRRYVWFSRWEATFVFIGIGLSWATLLGVGLLCIQQLRFVARNETFVETMLISKAMNRERKPGEKPFVFPYCLSARENLLQVLSWSGRPSIDGYNWPVRSGSSAFDFIRERQEQLLAKERASRPAVAVLSYRGNFFPFFDFGLTVAVSEPWCDLRRLRLQRGQVITISKRIGPWAFGNYAKTYREMTKEEQLSEGWFPLRCSEDISPSKLTLTDLELKGMAHTLLQSRSKKTI